MLTNQEYLEKIIELSKLVHKLDFMHIIDLYDVRASIANDISDECP